MPDTINGFSIDLEEWFQVGNLRRVVAADSWANQESRVCQNTEKLLDLLERTNSKATFFVLGWIANRQPALIKLIAGAGHEIASHGSNHAHLLSYSPQTLAQELRDEKSRLEDLTGTEVSGFRAPNFSIVPQTTWALEVLLCSGFKYDSSIMPVRRGVYGIPSSPLQPYRIQLDETHDILEIAPSAVSLFSIHIAVGGGGYFRCWPYAFTRWAAQRIARSGRPFCFYMHPWEIDPAQPRPSGVKPFSAFKHYHNLDVTFNRLEKLLTEFSFGTYQSIADAVSVSSSPLPSIRFK